MHYARSADESSHRFLPAKTEMGAAIALTSLHSSSEHRAGRRDQDKSTGSSQAARFTRWNRPEYLQPLIDFQEKFASRKCHPAGYALSNQNKKLCTKHSKTSPRTVCGRRSTCNNNSNSSSQVKDADRHALSRRQAKRRNSNNAACQILVHRRLRF